MKKAILLAFVALMMGSAAYAADFPITATIPAATTVKFVVSEVTPGATPIFIAHPSFSLDFNIAGTGMAYDKVNGIWVGSRFFAIDVAPTAANGDPAPGNYGSISFSYAGNTVPAGQPPTEGLNKRATLTAVLVDAQQKESVLRKGAIGNSFASLTNADVTGGFLRVYVGLATGETGANAIPGSVPFTNADKPGAYTGTLTITATLI